VVVRIDRLKRHRLYGKTMRETRRYKAHDEKNECHLGDVVTIAETRPLSREKRWRVVQVLQRGDVAEVAPREIGARIIEETRAAGEAEAAARAAAEAAAQPAEVEAPSAAVEPEPAPVPAEEAATDAAEETES
jgi:small subunit ribosomal protein S17